MKVAISVKRLRIVRVVLAAVVATTACMLPSTSHPAAAQVKQEVANRVLSSVVKLYGGVVLTGNGGPQLQILYSCSGTIIDPRGYILTNHHCTDIDGTLDEEGHPELKRNKKAIVVLLTKSADELPVATFVAEVVADSPRQGGLDLAVLHVTQDLKGDAVDDKTLNLPAITVGSSDKDHLHALDHITVIGYPGIGGDTVTFTAGNVSGFTYENGVQGRAWIKTDALVSGGNSGGTAINDAGELVGVPTEAGSGQKDAPSIDCRPVQDTNNDGKVDNKDVCVPISNNISALRPVDLAKPLIQRALAGLSPNTPPQTSPTASPAVPILPPGINPTAVANTPPSANSCKGVPASTGAPPRTHQGCVSRLIFSDGVTQDQQPQSIVTSLPSGSSNLIFFFDFYKFEDGAAFTPRVFINGQEVNDAWPTSAWSTQKLGSYGDTWVGFRDATNLPDGTYKFQVDYDNYTLSSATIQVGGQKQNSPAFNNISFAGGGKAGRVLPAGISRIDATYDWANVAAGTAVQATWLSRAADGTWNTLSATPPAGWSNPTSGKGGTLPLQGNTPLVAGDYRLELSVSGKLAATGDVTLTGGAAPNPPADQTPPPAAQAGFGPITFALGADANGKLIQPGTTFPSGVPELFAFFNTSGMRPNMAWHVTWLLNDKVVAEVDHVWAAADGSNGLHNQSLYSGEGQTLPDGKYEMRLLLQGQEQQRATAVIGNGGTGNGGTGNGGTGNGSNSGTGQGSNSPPVGNGVIIKGTIVDAYTGAPVAGAFFLVLKSGITWSTFDNTSAGVLDSAYTDQRGQFTLKVPLERGKSYSMGAGLRGYASIAQDNVPVTTDTPAIVDLSIKLEPQQ
ncbi:MAG: trypsin-like peptidase domain-containing protein [Chloroflexota bacterium]|nr:trypsin-like peptidase domain-containing protein [Chloroflexota bacterium]